MTHQLKLSFIAERSRLEPESNGCRRNKEPTHRSYVGEPSTTEQIYSSFGSLVIMCIAFFNGPRASVKHRWEESRDTSIPRDRCGRFQKMVAFGREDTIYSG
jgi:hypothetical protein